MHLFRIRIHLSLVEVKVFSQFLLNIMCLELRRFGVGRFALHFTIMTIATRPSSSSPHKEEQIRLTHFLVIFLPGHTMILYLDI